MGLSIHSLGVGWGPGRGSGGVETAFTKESILLVSGCHEGGQCGDLSPCRRGPRVTPVFLWIPFQPWLNAGHSWLGVYLSDAPLGRLAIHGHFMEPEGQEERRPWKRLTTFLTLAHNNISIHPFTACLFLFFFLENIPDSLSSSGCINAEGWFCTEE